MYLLVYRIAIVLVASIALLLLEPCCIAAETQGATGWTLYQLSRLSGKQTVKFDSNHVKMENSKTGLVSVLTGPPWKMTFYNDRQKLYFDSELWNIEVLMSEGFSGDGDLDAVEKATVHAAGGNPISLAGLKSQYYMMRNYSALSGSQRQIANREQLAALPSVEPIPVTSIDLWVSTDIKVPSQVWSFISRMYRTPHAPGIPLRAKSQDITFKQTTILDTYKCVVGKIPLSEFALPKGYKRAKTFRDMIFDQGAQTQALEMMRGFMDSDTEAEQRKAKKK